MKREEFDFKLYQEKVWIKSRKLMNPWGWDYRAGLENQTEYYMIYRRHRFMLRMCILRECCLKVLADVFRSVYGNVDIVVKGIIHSSEFAKMMKKWEENKIPYEKYLDHNEYTSTTWRT